MQVDDWIELPLLNSPTHKQTWVINAMNFMFNTSFHVTPKLVYSAINKNGQHPKNVQFYQLDFFKKLLMGGVG